MIFDDVMKNIIPVLESKEINRLEQMKTYWYSVIKLRVMTPYDNNDPNRQLRRFNYTVTRVDLPGWWIIVNWQKIISLNNVVINNFDVAAFLVTRSFSPETIRQAVAEWRGKANHVIDINNNWFMDYIENTPPKIEIMKHEWDGGYRNEFIERDYIGLSGWFNNYFWGRQSLDLFNFWYRAALRSGEVKNLVNQEKRILENSLQSENMANQRSLIEFSQIIENGNLQIESEVRAIIRENT